MPLNCSRSMSTSNRSTTSDVQREKKLESQKYKLQHNNDNICAVQKYERTHFNISLNILLAFFSTDKIFYPFSLICSYNVIFIYIYYIIIRQFMKI